jgi:hypothetical protein
VCILLLWVVSDEVDLREFPLDLTQEMSIRRSDRLMARFEQAAQEEAAAEARERGRPFGHGHGRVAPARAPAARHGRVRGPATGAAPLSHPIYKNINRAIIYASGSGHAYTQQIIKISQHVSRVNAYKL